MSNLTTPRSILVTLGFLAAIGLTPAGVPSSHAFGLGGGTKSDVESTKTIRELYIDFVKEWKTEPALTAAKAQVKEFLAKHTSTR